MNEKTIKCVILHLEFLAVKTDLEIKKKRSLATLFALHGPGLDGADAWRAA